MYLRMYVHAEIYIHAYTHHLAYSFFSSQVRCRADVNLQMPPAKAIPAQRAERTIERIDPPFEHRTLLDVCVP